MLINHPPTWDSNPDPNHNPNPTTISTIHNELSRTQTGHYKIELTIATTNADEYAKAHDRITRLLSQLLTAEPNADIDLETSNTVRSHFDTQPF